MKYDITSLKLADTGRRNVEWAERRMPVVRKIRERFAREKPLKGVRIAGCLHITPETANLARALVAGGAQLALCASNPLSTQDDCAAALVKHFKVAVFARKAVDRKGYYEHINAALDFRPQITIDDGADLVSTLHSERLDVMSNVLGGMEETTTGIVRLRAMAKAGALRYPIIAVNDAHTKYLFDNRYGTGQSTVDGIVRATNTLLAGKNIVCAGYGWCGRGFAMRARGLGAHVIVTEVNHLRAIEATMDGFAVMPMKAAAKIGDVFCTLTGDINVVRKEHFRAMKDGAIVCNSGHFNVEIDIEGLKSIAARVERATRPNLVGYVMKDGRTIYLLAEGRLVNLACAEGHPAEVMDMSFATQSLATEYVYRSHYKLRPEVIDVPQEVEDWISRTKLQTMGIHIDTLTEEQKKYLGAWQEGT
ncbi:MAG: adenosylhomocysteinase [Planctomycetota bacterium]|nr:adenosylhomocysteinase [Planctomycetota bacterium]